MHLSITNKIDPAWPELYKNSTGGTHSVVRPNDALEERHNQFIFQDETVENSVYIYLRISIIYQRVGRPDIMYFEQYYRVHAAIRGPMTAGWFKPSEITDMLIPVFIQPVAMSSIIT